MSKKYLITIKPLEPYFFGGEQTFGEGDDANYYAVSLSLPQQTTLMGMLRKEILVQSNLFKFDYSYSFDEKLKINELIGERSFDIQKISTEGKQSFGIIEKISPVFFNKNGLFYNLGPFDHDVVFKIDNDAKSYLIKEQRQAFFLENLNKNYEKEIIVRKDNENFIYDKSEVDSLFVPVQKIGITKNKTDKEDEEFYKKNSFMLKEGFAFSFIAELSDDKFTLKNNIVYIGGDGSKFSMEVAETDNTYEEMFSALKSKYKNSLTLISDALVDPEIYNYCEFAFTDIVDLRHITTSTGNYKFDKNKSKSLRCSLMKRGSVLYFSESIQIKNAENILNNDALKQVGYNIYNINKE